MSVVPHNHYNSTETFVRRNPYAPDLWIPYVLIGASCVTFLAVHFWCYHKRNRERYLRQRDEKRLKYGLMERRRITTLVLARYHSGLGIHQSETDIDLKQLYLDNCVDAATANKEITTTNINPNAQEPSEIPHDNTTSIPQLINIPTGTSISQDNQNNHKTITTSRTWPLVSERKSTPYNEHTTPCQQASRRYTDYASTPLNASFSNPTRPYHMSFTNQTKNKSIKAGKAKPHEAPTTTRMPNNNEHNHELRLSQSTSRDILQPSSSSDTSPSVFFTDVSSSYSTSSSQLTSSVKRKHSKQRYKGSPVERIETIHRDQYSTTCFPFNKWMCECSHPNCAYGGGKQADISIYDYGSYQRLKNSSSEASNPCLIQDESSTDFNPRTHGRLASGSFSGGKEMLALSDLRNYPCGHNFDFHSDPNRTCSDSSTIQLENPSLSFQDSDEGCYETDVDAVVNGTAPCIPESTSSRNIVSHEQTSFSQDRFNLNPSLVQGNTRSTVYREDPAILSTLKLLQTTKLNSSNVFGSTPTVALSDNHECFPNLQSTSAIMDTRPKERIVPSHGDWRSLEAEGAGSVAGDSHYEEDQSARRTPQLRSLDSKLVFQHRKQGNKSD